TLPLFDSLITAFRKRKFSNFAYPVLTLMIFLWFGFENGLWHPAWIVFLTVPCYYGIAHYIDYR
ncbi:MAG: XRE family transcriptional regulator, partial [Coprobacillus cateniformis]